MGTSLSVMHGALARGCSEVSEAPTGFMPHTMIMAQTAYPPTMSCESNKSRSPAGPEVVESSEIWLSDGNVIITAVEELQDQKVTHAFKCHKSVLAAHSTVFSDMFALPQPLNGTESYAGLPVVQLADAYKDIRKLLRMLYYPFE